MAVIPLYNVLVLPESNVYLKTERYRKATGRMPRPEERIVLLLQRKKEPNDKLTPESFYPIGVSGVFTLSKSSVKASLAFLRLSSG